MAAHSDLQQRLERALVQIIRDNLVCQYASQVPSLAAFRDALATLGDTDAALLAAFRTHVPFSTYASYQPFIDKFDAQPCRASDVVNMLSPGLPDFFVLSSGTSGGRPKTFPKYNHNARFGTPPPRIFDPNGKDPFAALTCTGTRGVKTIEGAEGQVVQRVPVCIITGGHIRRGLGWYTDDERWLSLKMPGFAVPLAATVIVHFPSFMIIHGLFFLACRNLYRFHTIFTTHFIDLMRHIHEHWDMLLSCIREGTIPDLEAIDHVRKYLQAHFHPNPERAAELLEIGPPLSSEGWFPRVWPKVDYLWTACTGTFATALPKVRSILGPNVPIRNFGYGSSELIMGLPYDAEQEHTFELRCDDLVEFLDVSLEAVPQHLCQAWQVEPGKSYEPIVTTRDGLWRYPIGDVLRIVGFHPERQAPLFTFVGRQTSTLRIPCTQIREDQLLGAVQACTSDAWPVHEFTTVVDERTLSRTIGFFVELAGPPGPDARDAPQRMFDALAARNGKLGPALKAGRMCLPTVRIVRPGTFASYRQWKGEQAGVVSGQIKVPSVLHDPDVPWILERVIEEL